MRLLEIEICFPVIYSSIQISVPDSSFLSLILFCRRCFKRHHIVVTPQGKFCDNSRCASLPFLKKIRELSESYSIRMWFFLSMAFELWFGGTAVLSFLAVCGRVWYHCAGVWFLIRLLTGFVHKCWWRGTAWKGVKKKILAFHNKLFWRESKLQWITNHWDFLWRNSIDTDR